MCEVTNAKRLSCREARVQEDAPESKQSLHGDRASPGAVTWRMPWHCASLCPALHSPHPIHFSSPILQMVKLRLRRVSARATIPKPLPLVSLCFMGTRLPHRSPSLLPAPFPPRKRSQQISPHSAQCPLPGQHYGLHRPLRTEMPQPLPACVTSSPGGGSGRPAILMATATQPPPGAPNGLSQPRAAFPANFTRAAGSNSAPMFPWRPEIFRLERRCARRAFGVSPAIAEKQMSLGIQYLQLVTALAPEEKQIQGLWVGRSRAAGAAPSPPAPHLPWDSA